MRRFVLVTLHNHTGDRYMYFIEHWRMPSEAEIDRFLEVYATHKGGETYDWSKDVVEIAPKRFNTIPSKALNAPF